MGRILRVRGWYVFLEEEGEGLRIGLRSTDGFVLAE